MLLSKTQSPLLRNFSWGFILVSALSTASAAPLDIRYSDLEKMATRGNGSIEAANLQWRAQDRKTGYLLRSFVPKFNVFGGYEYFQTGIYGNKTQPFGGATAVLNIFNGFRDYQEGRVRNSEAMLARVRSAVVSHEKLSQIRQLYLQLAYFKELDAVYTSILKTNEKGTRAAKVRQNRGLVTSTDIYEFDLHAGQIREEIASLRHEAEIYSIKLAAALGLEEQRDINPVDLLEHEHLDALTKADFSKSSAAGRLRIQAEEDVRAAHASQRAAWWLPSIDTYAEYINYTLRDRDYLDFQDRDDWAFGVRATWAVFDFEAFSQSRAASIEQDASTVDAKQKNRDFNAEVKTLQEELIHLHELVHNSEERVKLGERYLQSTVSDYDRGVKNSPDVISAIEKIVAFRKEFLDRKLDYHRTRDRLISLTQELR